MGLVLLVVGIFLGSLIVMLIADYVFMPEEYRAIRFVKKEKQ